MTDPQSHEPVAHIDPVEAVVRRRITIGAPLALVWDTLTSPDWIAEWFGQRADFPSGLHEGAVGSFGWTEHGDFPVRIERVEPESRFAFTWGTPGEPIRADNSTTAEFTLERAGTSTVVTVVESGFERLGDAGVTERALRDNAEGWTEELDDFVALVTRRWAPTVSDPDAGTLMRSIELPAPRDRVWEALTDPRAIERWWGHPADFPGGMQRGAIGTFAWQGQTFPIQILRFTPPLAWEFRWGELGDHVPGPTATDVRFSLDDAPGGTRLTVVELGWHRRAEPGRTAGMDDNRGGWNIVLDSLRDYLAGR